MSRSRLALVLTIFAAAPLTSGCFLLDDDVAFLEAEDIRMQPVREDTYRTAMEYGDVYTLSLQTAHEVNGWVGEAIESAGRVLEVLDRIPASSRDDDWKVYGPYQDEKHRAWIVRVDGDDAASRFETWVGPHEADGVGGMELLFWGDIDIDADTRAGSFSLDFDVLEAFEVKSGPNVDRHYTGLVDITFTRDTQTGEKHVTLDYTDFEVTQEVPVPEYFSADLYQYDREADGSGTFWLDVVATFQVMIWSGPELEEMTLDMKWDATGRGWAKGAVVGWEGEGDLAHGDLIIEECFDENGGLLYRDIADAYDAAFPDYDIADPSACTVAAPGKAPR